MNILDPIFFFILLLLGFNIKNLYSNFDQYERKLLNYLFIYHIFLSFVFFYTVNESGGDAIKYWYDAKTLNFIELKTLVSKDFEPTIFMYLLNYIPSNILELSFYIGNLFYAVIGFWGYVLFLQILKAKIPNYSNLRKLKVASVSIFPVLLFMPNLHFWTSGIGKDTLLFFAIILFIFAFTKKKRRLTNVFFAAILSFLVRPHMLLFLVVGFGLGYVLSSNVAVYKKGFILFIGLLILIPLLSTVLEFVNLESLDTNTIEEFSTTKADNLSEDSGSAIDLSSYPFPLKLLTFLYRPLFFDAPNVLGLVVSLENTFYILLTLSLFKKSFFTKIKNANFFIKGSFYFFIISACALSLILGNLGIIIREKTMILVPFFIVIFYINSLFYSEKNAI
jgi:hypothetical protein